jgi:hypothetical protein
MKLNDKEGERVRMTRTRREVVGRVADRELEDRTGNTACGERQRPGKGVKSIRQREPVKE